MRVPVFPSVFEGLERGLAVCTRVHACQAGLRYVGCLTLRVVVGRCMPCLCKAIQARSLWANAPENPLVTEVCPGKPACLCVQKVSARLDQIVQFRMKCQSA